MTIRDRRWGPLFQMAQSRQPFCSVLGDSLLGKRPTKPHQPCFALEG